MRFRTISALTLLAALSSVSPSFAAQVDFYSKYKPLAMAPTTEQNAMCIKDGGTYSKHRNGTWRCQPPKTNQLVGRRVHK